MGLGLSRGSEEGTMIVGGPGSDGMCSMIEWHIQHLTTRGAF
jgi:hypothetical protein